MPNSAPPPPSLALWVLKNKKNLEEIIYVKNKKLELEEKTHMLYFFLLCYCSSTKLCLTLFHPMNWSTPGFPVLHYFQSLHKLMSIESVMPSNHLILCCPLLLLPSVFPSIRVLSNESVLPIRWSKYWSFSFSISPSNECSRLISFMLDWFDLLTVQETLKILLQHHSSKASIL